MSPPASGLWRRAPSSPDEPSVTVTLDGREVRAFAGESVATLLLRLGYDHFGTHPTSGAPLAPWCLMGTCFGCLCTIDDRPGSQACLEPVRDGLVIVTDGATDSPSPAPR